MKANELKVKFIEWLISKQKKEDYVIGNEVLFSVDKCRADILLLKDNKMIAYEIKSDSDNFLDIDYQLNQYLSTFNYTYLVVTLKHIKQLEYLKEYNIGLILYDKDKFKILKKPLLSQQIMKENLVEFIQKQSLKNLIKFSKCDNLSVFKYRKLVVEKCSKNKIQEQAYNTLKNRYSRLFKLFLLDTSRDNIMIEDLKTLTGNITTDKLY